MKAKQLLEMPRRMAPAQEVGAKVREVHRLLREGLSEARMYARSARSADDWEAIAQDLMGDVETALSHLDR